MNYCHSATPLKEQTNILAWPRWMFLGIQKTKVTVMTMKKWNKLMSFFENPIHKIFLPANLVSGTFYRLFWIPSTTYVKDRRGKLSVLLKALCVSTSDSSVHCPKAIFLPIDICHPEEQYRNGICRGSKYWQPSLKKEDHQQKSKIDLAIHPVHHLHSRLAKFTYIYIHYQVIKLPCYQVHLYLQS